MHPQHPARGDWSSTRSRHPVPCGAAYRLYMDAREWTGSWWLPLDENKQVSGTLRFDPNDGISLELFDTLASDGDPLSRLLTNEERREPVIHGVTHQSMEVTLLDAMVVSQSSSQSKWRTEKEGWTARRAVLGIHVGSADTLTLNELSLSLDGLRSWGGRAPIEVTREDTPTLKWVQPERQVAEWAGVAIEMRHGHAIGWDPDSATLRDDLTIQVSLTEGIPLDALMSEYLQPLRNLASFVLDDAAFLRYVGCRGVSAPGYRRGPDADQGESRMDLIPIELLFDQIGRRRATSRERPLFTLDDGPVSFDELVTRWMAISKQGDLGSVLSQFFGLTFAPPEFTEVRFVALVHAMEEYHRRRVGGTAMPSNDFDARRERILDALGESNKVTRKDRKWLNGKFNRLNDLSLADRIRELVQSRQQSMESLIGDPAQFAERVATTRNFLSHGEESLSGRAASGLEIFFLERSLRQLFVALLLAEVGASDEGITSILSRNDWHRWVVEKTRDYGWAQGR